MREAVKVDGKGYYKQELCKSDVYIWKAQGMFCNGSLFSKAGDITYSNTPPFFVRQQILLGK